MYKYTSIKYQANNIFRGTEMCYGHFTLSEMISIKRPTGLLCTCESSQRKTLGIYHS